MLQTTTQMAFWLAPSEKSEGHPTKNTTVLSDHLLTKRVQIGWRGMNHVIAYDVTFGLPVGERHNHFVFEALTGYMPAEFSHFWGFNTKSGELESVTGPAREQELPLIFATENGSHAMGIFSPEPNPRYGQFRFPVERVVKWNCVFRRTDKDGVKPGDYSFRQFVIVGDLTVVRASMRALHREFARREQP
jgi:hypothetical protein